MEFRPLNIGELTAKIPVIQGGMGVGISLSGLAGAVAAQGGVGIISTAQIGYREEGFDQNPVETNLKAIGTEVAKARKIAGEGIIGVNIMVATHRYEDYVKAAVKAGVKAGEIVKHVCTVCGGSGGGKPDSAMGGGKDASKVEEALASVKDFVASKF